MTTCGLSSARAWTPLYMDLWRVEPPVTTRTFLCPKRWTMPLIWSRFSFATTTTTSWIHDTLPGDAKEYEWFHKYQTVGKYRNIRSVDPVPVKTTRSWIKLEQLQKRLKDKLLIGQSPRAWGEHEERADSWWRRLQEAWMSIPPRPNDTGVVRINKSYPQNNMYPLYRSLLMSRIRMKSSQMIKIWLRILPVSLTWSI